MGTILILNGASSSGKTTLLRLLQNRLAEPYLEAGIDKFIWMLPKRYLDVPHWHEIFEYRWVEQDGQCRLEICAGPQGKVMFSGMHRAIATLARSGSNVLADHVLIEPEWVEECARLFAGLPAYLIGVRCSLEILEERERARRDRTLGQARAYHEKVHAHGVYDLEVDTGRDGPETCAQQVIDFLDARPAPRAFPALCPSSHSGLFPVEAELLTALAHPSRLEILELLRYGERCVCHLQAVLDQRQAYVSQHLNILRHAGMVTKRKDGKRVYYQASSPQVFELIDSLKAFMRSQKWPQARIPDEAIFNSPRKPCTCPQCAPSSRQALSTSR